MDIKAQIRDFLASRRARLTPQQAGLPAHGGARRRVPGLRREEVAMLAGVSSDYYTRLERGHLHGASDEVLEALARALHLSEAERLHLFDLARAASPTRTRPRRPVVALRPTIQRILDALHESPAFARNGRLDVLGTNALGRALYAPMYDSPHLGPGRVNTARFHFLDVGAATSFWGERWDRMAHDIVAVLRAEAGRNPYDPELTSLVGELSTRSEPFRQLWALHDVHLHRSGTKTFCHPLVGRLDLEFEALTLPGDPGVQLNIYTAAPDTPSADALAMLASWAATGSSVT